MEIFEQNSTIDSKNYNLWKNLSTEEKALLFLIINNIENNQNTPSSGLSDKAEFSLLESKQIIEIIDDNILFSSDYCENYFSAHYYISKETLHKKDYIDIITYTIQLRENLFKGSYEKWKFIGKMILLILINNFDRSDILIDYTNKETIDDWIFWDILKLLTNLIPILNTSSDIAHKFLSQSVSRAGRDTLAIFFQNKIVELGSSRPDFSLEIVNHIDSNFLDQDDSILESLLIGISKSESHINKVIAICEKLSNSIEIKNIVVGINVFLYLTKENKYEMQQYLKILESQDFHYNELLQFELAICYTDIGLTFPDFIDLCLGQIQKLKTIGDIGKINQGICRPLSYRQEITNNYQKFLNLLIDSPLEDAGLIKIIQSILIHIITSNPNWVWYFFESWINCHNTNVSIIDRDMFENGLLELFRTNKSNFINKTIEWFSSTNLKLVEQSRDIISTTNIMSFPKDKIIGYSKNEIIYIVEKLLAGKINVTQLLSIILGMINETTYREELNDYFIRCLLFIAQDYPGTTKEILNNSIKQKTYPNVSSIIDTIIKYLSERIEEKQIIIPLIESELIDSKSRVRKFYELQSKALSRIGQSTISSNSFINLLHEIDIGRGDRSFHMNIFHQDPLQKRTFTEPRGFSQFSHSMEIPSNEFIDPEYFTFSRIHRTTLILNDIKGSDE